jgi:hypothetical protein
VKIFSAASCEKEYRKIVHVSQGRSNWNPCRKDFVSILTD